jgi:hypothetical protein
LQVKVHQENHNPTQFHVHKAIQSHDSVQLTIQSPHHSSEAEQLSEFHQFNHKHVQEYDQVDDGHEKLFTKPIVHNPAIQFVSEFSP